MSNPLAMYFGPQLPFFYRKGFNYQQYLEQKSHFDSVVLAIDESALKLAVSQEEIAKRSFELRERSTEEILGSINNVSQIASQGFYELSTKLDSIDDNINILLGMTAEIIGGLHVISENIEKLVEASQAPDQTWALEQYHIAQHAFKNKHFEESYDYVNRAINGYMQNPGYRLEHRFYKLRGLLHFGDVDNFKAEFINLDSAISDFLSAVKYSELEDPMACAEAYGLAGIACYCDGRVTTSIEYLLKSASIRPDSGTFFNLGKSYFHTGDIVNAKKYFYECIKINPFHSVKAYADPDYLLNKDHFEGVLKQYQSELNDEIDSVTSHFSSCDFPGLLNVMSKNHYKDGKDVVNDIEEIVKRDRGLQITDLANVVSNAESVVDVFNATLSGLLKHLTSMSKMGQKIPSGDNIRSFVLVALTVFVAIVALYESLTQEMSFFEKIFNVIMGALGGAFLGVIFGYPMQLVYDVYSGFKRKLNYDKRLKSLGDDIQFVMSFRRSLDQNTIHLDVLDKYKSAPWF